MGNTHPRTLSFGEGQWGMPTTGGAQGQHIDQLADHYASTLLPNARPEAPVQDPHEITNEEMQNDLEPVRKLPEDRDPLAPPVAAEGGPGTTTPLAQIPEKASMAFLDVHEAYLDGVQIPLSDEDVAEIRLILAKAGMRLFEAGLSEWKLRHGLMQPQE